LKHVANLNAIEEDWRLNLQVLQVSLVLKIVSAWLVYLEHSEPESIVSMDTTMYSNIWWIWFAFHFICILWRQGTQLASKTSNVVFTAMWL